MARRKPLSRVRTADSADTADRLHSAAIHLLRRLRGEDDASGLTAPRLSALSVLVFGGPRSVSALAAAEQVRLPTMSRLVRDLARDGLVRVESDPDDARARRVVATETGRRILAEGRARRVARLAEEVGRLGPDERRLLAAAADLLEALARTPPLRRGPRRQAR